MNRKALETLLEKVETGSFDRWSTAGAPLTAPEKTLANKAYEGSLDAAKALHEAVLPGWSYLLGHVGAEDSGAMVFSDPHADLDEVECVETDNAARSWLAAILKALIAESDQ